MRLLSILFLFSLCSKEDIRNIDEDMAYLATSAGWQPRNLTPSQSWSSVNTNPSFNSRDGAGLVYYNGLYYLLGGWDDPSGSPATNNEVWTSPDLITWTQQSNAPWAERHSFGNFVFNNKIWVVGGDYNTDIWTFDGNWTEVNSNADCLQNKRVMSVGVHNNKIWVIGGWKEVNNAGNVTITQYDDVWSSPDGVTWTLVNSSPGFSPRGAVYGIPSFGGKMWVIGGTMMTGINNAGDPNPANRIPVFEHYTDIWNSVDGITWTNITADNWTGKAYSNCVMFDNKLWVMAGYNATEGNTNKVYYSYNGQNWYQMNNIPFSGKHAASVCVNGNTLYLACGSEDSGISKNIWKLN